MIKIKDFIKNNFKENNFNELKNIFIFSVKDNIPFIYKDIYLNKRKLQIKKDEDGKYYYNENGQRHRLTGPAVEWSDGNKAYYINDIFCMHYNINYNILHIHPGILKSISKHEKYIKQNIKDLIQKYNPEIALSYFKKEEINNLPNWLENLNYRFSIF